MFRIEVQHRSDGYVGVIFIDQYSSAYSNLHRDSDRVVKEAIVAWESDYFDTHDEAAVIAADHIQHRLADVFS